MTEELNPKTLDLIGVLSGRDYPTLDIEVYFNEALGFSIHELQKMLKSVEILGSDEEVKELREKVQGLVKESTEQKYTITLKAVPESVRRNILTKIQEEFPDKTDMMGRTQPNPAGDEAYTTKMWGAYVKTVTAPDGSSKLVEEADIKALYANAPSTVHEQITLGIQELLTGAKSGFEFAAKEVDFLSQASPEG